VSGLEKKREWSAKKLAAHEVRREVLGLLFVIGCHPDLKRSSFSTHTDAKYGIFDLDLITSTPPRSSEIWSTQ